LPGWLERLPLIRPALRALGEATPTIAHDAWLITQCTGLQLAIFTLDAGTLWIMLWALGLAVNPAPVFASFMLSTLARTLGVIPGGLGVFEAVSVATLELIGVPVAAGLAATLLFRFFTFWLPMAPGLILARREARA
jgi:Mg2+-importing ATPase